jgi:serine/threonine-protein kinase HipA
MASTGILPEESKREIVGRSLGVSARNDYATLERIGAECSGAVTLVATGEPLPERNYGNNHLFTEELIAILKELPRCPLAHSDDPVWRKQHSEVRL